MSHILTSHCVLIGGWCDFGCFSHCSTRILQDSVDSHRRCTYNRISKCVAAHMHWPSNCYRIKPHVAAWNSSIHPKHPYICFCSVNFAECSPSIEYERKKQRIRPLSDGSSSGKSRFLSGSEKSVDIRADESLVPVLPVHEIHDRSGRSRTKHSGSLIRPVARSKHRCKTSHIGLK